jgi:hypothetical protein
MISFSRPSLLLVKCVICNHRRATSSLGRFVHNIRPASQDNVNVIGHFRTKSDFDGAHSGTSNGKLQLSRGEPHLCVAGKAWRFRLQEVYLCIHSYQRLSTHPIFLNLGLPTFSKLSAEVSRLVFHFSLPCIQQNVERPTRQPLTFVGIAGIAGPRPIPWVAYQRTLTANRI